MNPNPVFTQVCLGTLLISGSFLLSQWHRANFDAQASQAFTTTHTQQIATDTIAAYRRSPFPLAALIRHYETVRDVDGRSPQTRRIFALGAERLTAANNRLTLIQSRVQSSANPTAFLATNINRQETALTEFISQHDVIPPGSKLGQAYAVMLLELELWLRAQQHFTQQTMVAPLPQNPKSLLN